MAKHVAVLMGGLSSEREVSLESGKAVIEALEGTDYKVTPVDVGHDIGRVLTELKPDVAFVALHGTYGEDGCIQGLLEIIGIPYTHSGVLPSALALNKVKSREIFKVHAIPHARGKIIKRQNIIPKTHYRFLM